MGARPYYLDEAQREREQAVRSDAMNRDWDRLIAAKEKQISAVMADQLETARKQLTRSVDQVARIAGTGRETVQGIREALRERRITVTEAEEQIAACLDEADNTLRPLLDNSRQAEERVWSEVNMTPAAYERAMAKRAPALFRAGRSLLVLPTDD